MKMELNPNKITQRLMLDQQGDYEKEISDLMRTILLPGDCFIDCGAHVGYFTVLGAALGADVLAFEPNMENFEDLNHNIVINEFTNVKIFNDAVGDKNETLEMFTCLDNDGGHAFWDVSKHPFNSKTLVMGKPKQEVRMVTLDSVVNCPVKLIKMDIEGCEFKALKGAMNLIKDCHPAIIIEINDGALREMGTCRTEILSFMEGLGYRCFDMETGELIDNDGISLHQYVYDVVFIEK